MPPDFKDKKITCADCHQSFVFSAGAQRFHAEKRFLNQPKRCPECRAQRHRGWQARLGPTTIICANCGTEDEVSFVPRYGRPVYCANCFRTRGR